jgi:hypothetical protein
MLVSTTFALNATDMNCAPEVSSNLKVLEKVLLLNKPLVDVLRTLLVLNAQKSITAPPDLLVTIRINAFLK